jgi:hypothetical protein
MRSAQVIFVNQARVLEEQSEAFSMPTNKRYMVFWGDIYKKGRPTGEQGWRFVKQANPKFYMTNGRLSDAWNIFWSSQGVRIGGLVADDIGERLRPEFEGYIRSLPKGIVNQARARMGGVGRGGIELTYRGRRLTAGQINKALNVKTPTARTRAIAKRVVREYK